ncbi:MAG: transglutaminase domain-containing protein [Spirochaetales bacterium]|nr:transglutaminase domain-containing protein [Spirochaetales bacterium]
MYKKKFLLWLLFLLTICSCSKTNSFNNTGKKIIYNATYSVTLDSNTSHGSIIVRLPKNYKYRQRIIKEEFSIKPKKIFMDGDDRLALFSIKETVDIDIKIIVEIYKYDFYNAVSDDKNFDEEIYTNNLILNNKVNNELIELAEKLKSDSDIDTIKNIYNYINDNINYREQDIERLGYEALKTGNGDCSDFSDLFVTLCRINNIKSRTILGYGINGEYGHHWVEVLYDSRGWIPIEPVASISKTFTFPPGMKNYYLYFGFNIFNYNYTFKVTNGLSVEDSFSVNNLTR